MAIKATTFQLGITDSLILSVMQHGGCTAEDVVQFFVMQVEKLLELPPNITRRSRYAKVSADKEIWVLRGYYPGTSVFFKVSAVRHKEDPNDKYAIGNDDRCAYVKVSSPESKTKQVFHSGQIQKELADTMLVGAQLNLKLKTQRTLTPKGLKKLSMKGKKKRKNVDAVVGGGKNAHRAEPTRVRTAV